MTLTRRERQREAAATEIKAVARQQMAENGPNALSLRGIASAIGMTAPAIYRYFPSRDDLVTALIVDAYRALGEAIDGAQAALPAGDYPGRWVACAVAYRRWAMAHQGDFALIFGTPIPGYHAPPEVTVPVVVEAFRPFIAIPEAALAAGCFDWSPERFGSAPATDARLAASMGTDSSLPPALLRGALEGWAVLHGAVTLEIVGQLPPLLGDAAEFLEVAIRSFVGRFGMRAAGGTPMARAP